MFQPLQSRFDAAPVAPVPPAATTQDAGVRPELAPARILIADDERFITHVVQRSLQHGNYEVDTVHDGMSAIEAVRGGDYQLVITDMSMPGASGIDVIKASKEHNSEIEVIVITGAATLNAAIEALRAGAYDFIEKPFEDPKVVPLAVERALERQRLMRENEEMLDKLRSRTEELELVNAQLVEAQGQLVQAGKMGALGQLSAGLAHEISNPLNFILGDLYLLGRDVKRLTPRAQDPTTIGFIDTLRERHGRLRDGARRIETIINSLRSFSRPCVDSAEPLDVNNALDQVLVILESKFKTREHFHIERDYGDIPAVNCVTGQVSQVYMNIVDNAIQAVKGPGSVTIRTQLDPETECVVVSVKDSGDGIPEEVLPKIFDPFFTTKAAGEGTGLGLSISYGVIARHSGRIWADNNPDGGASFHVSLPVKYSGLSTSPDVTLRSSGT